MNERPGYGDDEAKRIIERAAEIDAEQGRQLDVLALREIAAQAGISSLAVDRALEEHEATTVKRVPWLRRHRTLLTVAVIAATFLVYALSRRVFPEL